MKRMTMLLAAAVPLTAVLVPMAANAVSRDQGGTRAATTCAALPVSAPTGTKVESVTAVAHAGGTLTFPANPPLTVEDETVTDVPAWCDITVTVTHPGADDHVAIKISLPQDPAKWSGRFQATGGSAYLAGDLTGSTLVKAVKDGYAAAATDAGVGANPIDVSGWALTSDGEVNEPALTDFASRSLHDMAVVGKDVTKRFYSRAASYSYWNGCSTGGRQGYEEAQAYPADFNGILAKAPAISWDRFAVATLWPQVVFNEAGIQPTQCELGQFNTAAVKACDTLDGVKDGVIDDPRNCHWNARRLIGTTVVCDGKELTISAKLADAVNKIWAGPVSPSGQKLWYGPEKGASFGWLANAGEPFFVADTWTKYFLKQDPAFPTAALTYSQFYRLFRQSQYEYNSVIGSDEENLSAFARAGGKLLSWHGQADELVPTGGTIDYRERVDRLFGGDQKVDDFYRLFLLPNGGHCGDNGTVPANDLSALVNWVEKGQAPDTLTVNIVDGSGTATVREICKYPHVARCSNA